MQDKTINNDLQAIRKQGGTEGKLAEVLRDMRGVGRTDWVIDRPLKRGEAKRLVMDALRDVPKITSEIANLMQKSVPDLSRHIADNPAYLSLRRYEGKGMVVQDSGSDGCLWRVC